MRSWEFRHCCVNCCIKIMFNSSYQPFTFFHFRPWFHIDFCRSSGSYWIFITVILVVVLFQSSTLISSVIPSSCLICCFISLISVLERMYPSVHHILVVYPPSPVTVAERSEACTVFTRSEPGVMGSNPTQGVVCVCVCSVFVYLLIYVIINFFLSDIPRIMT
jgi:hypothetical protein